MYTRLQASVVQRRRGQAAERVWASGSIFGMDLWDSEPLHWATCFATFLMRRLTQLLRPHGLREYAFSIPPPSTARAFPRFGSGRNWQSTIDPNTYSAARWVE